MYLVDGFVYIRCCLTCGAVIKVEPGKTRVGWVGTGVMGSSMCGHVMDAGFSATVFNRTVSKTESVQTKGAKLAASPKEVCMNVVLPIRNTQAIRGSPLNSELHIMTNLQDRV